MCLSLWLKYCFVFLHKFTLPLPPDRVQGFRHSPRHARRSARARVSEETKPLVDIAESEPDSTPTVRKRKVKKRVQPEFYQSIQVTPTRKPVGILSIMSGVNCKLYTT